MHSYSDYLFRLANIKANRAMSLLYSNAKHYGTLQKLCFINDEQDLSLLVKQRSYKAREFGC